MAICDLDQCQGCTGGRAAALFPLLQGTSVDMKGFGELGLRQPGFHSGSRHFDRSDMRGTSDFPSFHFTHRPQEPFSQPLSEMASFFFRFFLVIFERLTDGVQNVGSDISPDTFGIDNHEPGFTTRQTREINDPHSPALSRPSPWPSDLSALPLPGGCRPSPDEWQSMNRMLHAFFRPQFSVVGDEGRGSNDGEHEQKYTSLTYDGQCASTAGYVAAPALTPCVLSLYTLHITDRYAN